MASHGHFHWNELLTRDVERAKKFYQDTIGWSFSAMPMENGTYWLAMVDGVTLQVGETSIAAEKAFAMAGRSGIDAVQFRLDKSASGTVTLRVVVNGVESNTMTLQVQ